MDEIIEHLIKGVLKYTKYVVRILWYFAWDLCLHEIGWYVGWPIVKIITLGKYPTCRYSEDERASRMEAGIVYIVGFVFLIVAGALLTWVLLSMGVTE
jgi:hypothetical protein